MGKFFKDFKDFALKGNIIDMAVGVVIGGAFGKIVTSLVENIITPLIGSITGKVSLAELECKVNNVSLKYGAFIQSIIDFLIIAFSIFVVLRLFMNLKNKFEKTTEDEVIEVDTELSLLKEIRDELKNKQ